MKLIHCFLGLFFALPGQGWLLADQVKINEIMYHPGLGSPGEAGYVAEDTDQEYIELYNAGTNAVNLNGWRLKGAVSFAFTNVTIPPQEFLVIAGDSDPSRFKNNYQAQYPGVTNATVLGGWAGILSNNGETITLEDGSGKRVDEVTYASEGDWAQRRVAEPYPGSPTWWRGWQWTSGADAGGKSLELINPVRSNKYGQNWGASLNNGGTPGGPNSILSNVTAPFIREVKHAPAVPKSTEAVTITARIIDEVDSNVTVVLHWRLDGAGTFSSTPMVDDGQHGDGLAADGTYGATVPAQANTSIVEFYVEAIGAGNLARTWPAPSDGQATQGANALYQVDDTVYAGQQPVYRFIIPVAEWNAWINLMDNVSGGRYSDATMNATLITVDGLGTEVRYGVGVRNRGAGTRAAHPHNLHVIIPNDHPWRNRTGLDLNTRTVHSQVAGNAINVMAGVPNTYGAPVQVRINGRNLANLTPTGGTDSYQFGSYYAFQPYGTEWLKEHYPTDSAGNLYKGVWNFDNHSLQHPANLAYLGSDPAAYRLLYSPTGPTADTGPYSKQNNTAADDWSDLINLCQVLDQAPDATYLEQLNQMVNVDEWLNYFAVTTLIGNQETTFGTGIGDDYSMYRGVKDPRFQILPHDMDTTLGQGDTGANYGRSIFEAAGIPVVNRLLKHPAITPRYYAILKQQANTTFSPEKINPLLDQVLGDWVPADIIMSMKEFLVQRNANVLSQIPSALSVTSNLPVVNGYLKASSSSVSLSGIADAINTRSVLVNGVAATWTQWSGSWSANNLNLLPGINRVGVQALDLNGKTFETAYMDIWFDNGALTAVAGGTLSSDTTWTAATGPYHITGNLTVGSGVTLTIQPGTTVYLGSGVNLVVANGGRILAEGAEGQQIRFASLPGSGTSWSGITLNGAIGSPETRLAYVFFEGNSQTCIEVAGGTLYLDHADFGTTTHQYVALDGSSFLLKNCHFPTSTAAFELLHGTGGIKSGGHGIVRECFFGSTTGYNDIMDFTGGNRPGQAIIQYYNNVFIGASDDILDLDGTDAWIEGNIFMHTHKNGSPDSSSAISGGNDSGNTSEVTIIGNIFYDCDHVATAKQGNFYTLINNTVVRQTHQGGLDTDGAVVNLADDGTTEGVGMYLEGNIIFDAEKLVRNQTAGIVTFTNNLMTLPWNGPGGGNSADDPLFKHIPQLAETVFTSWEQAQVMRDWFSLLPGSAAVGTGPNGRDKGGVIPNGVSISGVLTGTTFLDSATLTVGPLMKGNGIPTDGFPNGSGFTHYQWKVDDSPFSAETPTSTPITLTGLANGPHTVTVIGKNDALYYQNDPELGPDATVTQSRTWIVDTAWRGQVRINEVLAFNNGAFTNNGAYPDAIELYNDDSQTVDLSGMALSTGLTNQNFFIFPAGITLGSGQYLTLSADNLTNLAGLHLGFGLNRLGDSLFLVDRQGNVIDSITFGLQLPNLSIGRLPIGQWGLTQPTLGSANIPQSMGNPQLLKINEWLAHAVSVFPTDFVELYNPGTEPVALGGLVLADQSVGQPGLPALAPLSFIGGKSFTLFYADNRSLKGANHLAFTLAPGPNAIGLFADNLTPIDVVFYGPQTPDVSQGRSPNGAETIVSFAQPTPGFVNPGSANNTTITTQTFPLIASTNVWKYDQTSIPASDWITPGFTGDASWPAGAALLYVESNSKPWPKNTPLTLGRTTYYFRTHFQVTTNLDGAVLSMHAIIDDGAVFYLNGEEVYRLHMPTGPVTYDTHAQDHESALEGPFTLSVTNLVAGDNVMAVEVHQVNNTSTDIVFGLALDAVLSITNSATNAEPAKIMINEIMAHNVSLTNQAGLITDWIELYNPSTNAIDLADASLTDDATLPRKWVFPPNSFISGKGYLAIQCDGNTNASGINTGFGLKSEGGAVYLFDTPAHDGTLWDSLSYGLQIADFSIGRLDTNSHWTLNQPTPGSTNVAASMGNLMALKINEWMANPIAGDDWFELYNPEPQPVDVSGLYLTDNFAQPDQYCLPTLSYLGTGTNGFQKFNADSSPTKGANHTNFKLSASGEFIGLFATNLAVIDQVTFGAQTLGVSEGRFPDGSTNLVRFDNTPTPGGPNVLTPVLSDSDHDGMPDIWELAHGLNPNDPTDAFLDSDSDGLTNLQEFQAGTDPQDANSALRAAVENRPGNSIIIHFTAQAGKSYSVQYRDSLTSGTWFKLHDITASPAAINVEASDPYAPVNQTRYYRIVTPVAP